jgi:hypothetical protein
MPLIRGNCSFSKMTMRRMGVRVTIEKVRRILPDTVSFCPDDMEGSFDGTDPFSTGHE